MFDAPEVLRSIQRLRGLATLAGVSRFYWYGWTDGIFGLSDWRGLPKPAGDGWRWAVEQMSGNAVTGCVTSGSTVECKMQSLGNSKETSVRWSDPSALTPRSGPAAGNPAVRLELQ